jgi:hypothetical protein
VAKNQIREIVRAAQRDGQQMFAGRCLLAVRLCLEIELAAA